jgi:hypothetical protein
VAVGVKGKLWLNKKFCRGNSGNVLKKDGFISENSRKGGVKGRGGEEGLNLNLNLDLDLNLNLKSGKLTQNFIQKNSLYDYNPNPKDIKIEKRAKKVSETLPSDLYEQRFLTVENPLTQETLLKTFTPYNSYGDALLDLDHNTSLSTRSHAKPKKPTTRNSSDPQD